MPHLCSVTWWLLLVFVVSEPGRGSDSDLAQTDGDAGPAASDAISWASAHRGDVRAVIRLSAELSSAPVQAEIVWRRRDKDPAGKRVLVTDSNDKELPDALAPKLTLHSGTVVFTPDKDNPNQTYYVYWLPYTTVWDGGIRQVWDGVSDQHDWQPAGIWSATGGSAAPQNFSLTTPKTGRFWRMTDGISISGWQGVIRELCFRSVDEGWLRNNATKSHPLPVTGASSWQPTVIGDGMPWNAMDGNDTTVWDPRGGPATLDVDFLRNITIDQIAVSSSGDTEHDPKTIKLQVAPAPPPGHGHEGWQNYPRVPAEAITIQPRTAFESFDPMELAANSTEVADMMRRYGNPPFVLFTEDSANPVRMTRNLPVRWTSRLPGPQVKYSADVTRGSFVTFQIAVYVPPHHPSLHNLTIHYTGFSKSLSLTCINLEGVNQNNMSFTNTAVSAPSGHVYSLWIGVDGVSETAAPGTEYRGSVHFGASGGIEKEVDVLLRANSDTPWANRGDNVPERYTRIRWLNSQRAQDYDLVRPYTAVEIYEPATLGILNRNVTISKAGLPQEIVVATAATKHGTLPAKVSQLLIAPFTLSVTLMSGSTLEFKGSDSGSGPQIHRDGPGKVSWSALSSAGSSVAANISMTLEMDGFMEAEIALSSSGPAVIKVDNVSLSVGIAAMQHMGFECRGSALFGPGAINSEFMNCSIPRTWKWSSKSTSSLWAGSAEAGLRLFLKASADDRVSAPDGSSLHPPEWGAGDPAHPWTGGGGARLDHKQGGLNLIVFTGPQTIGTETAPLRLYMDLAVTPFHTRNETDHWASRYYQIGYKGPEGDVANLSLAEASKATVINVHQGVAGLNEYISYPFVPAEVAQLESFTTAAAAGGIRAVKFYYTIGELSNHAAEIWVSRMLGDEIYATPDCGYADSGGASSCGGSAWQQLHLEGGYQPSWQQALVDGNVDAANRQSPGAGRWSNCECLRCCGLRHWCGH